MNRRLTAIALATGYFGTIVAANWAVQHYGAVPVWPGLLAPATGRTVDRRRAAVAR